MLEQIRILNFRGFKDHVLPTKGSSIIVGINNAGKSSIVEALRLISLVTNRYKYLNYSRPPFDSEVPLSLHVVSPSLESIQMNFETAFHLLGNPPCVIQATFSDGEIIDVYVTRERVYGAIRNSEGHNIENRKEANKLSLPKIHILPQVAPLVREEKILGEKYVMSNTTTDLSHLHFRNQLRLMKNEYKEFVKLAAATWPGLGIRELVGEGGLIGDPLGLLVTEGDFVGEVSWMGHGLQVWLQVVWFIVRTPSNAIVVLDEPDVYLHPDIQRKLIRLMKSTYSQCIITTHSIEIMSEVDPSEILIVDKKIDHSRYADDYPTLKKLTDHIGSAHNVNLARISSAKKFIIIEGDDLGIISLLHNTLFSKAESILSSLPNLPLGGWGGWDYAIGSKLTFENYIGNQVTIYCILDRDYHTPEQLNKRYDQAVDRGIELHIWVKKELENYLIIPSVIKRVIELRMEGKKKTPNINEIESQLDSVAKDLKEKVRISLGTEFENDDRRGGLANAMKKANIVVDAAWADPETRLGILPGKEVISELSKWAQKKYGVSFGPMSLARNIRKEEINSEMVAVLKLIEEGNSLNNIRPRRFTEI